MNCKKNGFSYLNFGKDKRYYFIRKHFVTCFIFDIMLCDCLFGHQIQYQKGFILQSLYFSKDLKRITCLFEKPC